MDYGVSCVSCALLLVMLRGTEANLCKAIEVTGAWFQKSREGTYLLMTQGDPSTNASFTCFGKAMWKQNPDMIGQSNVIYFHGRSQSWNGWMVGTEPCSNMGGLAATDMYQQHDSPDQFPGEWEEAYDGAWRRNPDIQVRCISPEGTPFPVIIAFSVFVAMLISLGFLLLIYKCCLQEKNRRTQPQIQPPSHPVQPPLPPLPSDWPIPNQNFYHPDPPPSYEEATATSIQNAPSRHPQDDCNIIQTSISPAAPTNTNNSNAIESNSDEGEVTVVTLNSEDADQEQEDSRKDSGTSNVEQV